MGDRHPERHNKYIISFHLQGMSLKIIRSFIIMLIYSKGNWGGERSNNLPGVTGCWEVALSTTTRKWNAVPVLRTVVQDLPWLKWWTRDVYFQSSTVGSEVGISSEFILGLLALLDWSRPVAFKVQQPQSHPEGWLEHNCSASHSDSLSQWICGTSFSQLLSAVAAAGPGPILTEAPQKKKPVGS